MNRNTIGNNLIVTLFGESHGTSVGVVIDGISSGVKIDLDFIRHQLNLRRPSNKLSTSRVEEDNFVIHSGVFNGFSTGTPITITIDNNKQNSSDYSKSSGIARPSHSDYTANVKYHGFQDYRGGGHFSGRVTAALVAAGAILISALKTKNIMIGTHLKSCGGIYDREFGDYLEDIKALSVQEFPVLDPKISELYQEVILYAREQGDSVGGTLESVVYGLPAGVGEPWFGTLEGMLAGAIFSIPGVKGVEFGAGFEIALIKGSQANDQIRLIDGKVITTTNNSGGINGGISNGMPIIINTAMKPTPSIFKCQDTINYLEMTNVTHQLVGRHDPCIAHRGRIVLDSIIAIVLADLLITKYGNDYLMEAGK